MTMTGTLFVPESFTRSYAQLDLYPRNLVNHLSYAGAIKGYSSRLDKQAQHLFISKDYDIDIPFRDFRSSGKGDTRLIRNLFLPGE